MKQKILLSTLVLVVAASASERFRTGTTTPLRFEVSVASGLLAGPQNGRLFVVMSKRSAPQPRESIGQTGLDAPPMFARDVSNFGPGMVGVIDEKTIAFPIPDLAHLPAGDYFVQALFDYNVDLKSVNAPGNLYSKVKRMRLDPASSAVVSLELTEKVPPEQLPAETEHIKYVKLQSKLLSEFHGRPIYLRAGIILPRRYSVESQRRYPLRVHIGGYGDRFTGVRSMMAEGSPFYRAWSDEASPPMLTLFLDGDGPFGDCYQVNSDNNGPYGDAVTQELIPYVEQKFRGVSGPWARVLEGGSTGGWVSLALQIFYPDFFAGTWSGFPDGVDFRAFQLVDIYSDDNAYVNEHGFERPSARDLNGDVRFTIRHECQMENVMGVGDSWTMSGEQWGAWNATYGPKGADGRPIPLWDAKTGKIDRSVVDHWKKYDLRLVLEKNWKTLGPKLEGKLHIWVGEADDYFLNNAVHLLDRFLSGASPAYGGSIVYGPGKGHGWNPLGERALINQMTTAIEKAKQRQAAR